MPILFMLRKDTFTIPARAKVRKAPTKLKFPDIWKKLTVHYVLHKYAIRTTVSRLLAAVPVHLPMILSMHFLWMAALHSDKKQR